jgi:hypothetical protein
MDFQFIERNIVSTLILNQFFFFNIKERPRLVRLLVFFNLLREFSFLERTRVVRLIYFLFVFLRGRGLVRNFLLRRGRGFERSCWVGLSICGSELIEVLYNLFSLVLSKVDLFTFIYKKYLNKGIISVFFSVICSGFLIRVRDLRGVYFFDRSSVFFNWNELVSFFFFLVSRNQLRSERIVLLRNWKLVYAI